MDDQEISRDARKKKAGKRKVVGISENASEGVLKKVRDVWGGIENRGR